MREKATGYKRIIISMLKLTMRFNFLVTDASSRKKYQSSIVLSTKRYSRYVTDTIHYCTKVITD